MKSNIISINSYKMNYHVSGGDGADNLLQTLEQNFQNGAKNIGIASTHYNSLQQNFILLALNYFNHKYPHLKIGVVSFSCDSGQLQEFKVHASPTKKEGVFSYSGHFDLISWDSLLANKSEKLITDTYDILLWELPEVEKLAKASAELKESLENINAIFIVSNRLKADSDDNFARRVGQYFLNHGVNITNILPLPQDKNKNGFEKIIDTVSGVFKKAS